MKRVIRGGYSIPFFFSSFFFLVLKMISRAVAAVSDETTGAAPAHTAQKTFFPVSLCGACTSGVVPSRQIFITVHPEPGLEPSIAGL